MSVTKVSRTNMIHNSKDTYLYKERDRETEIEIERER